ncbi:MAG: PfkB family carbohydrate kinase [Fimbriimonadaceae bacterium]|jgi:rfaE bifunctional protein kinase chain/domain|nr:PfkB family carbohydrate kinase [Fimbriimonadaceae bacterium]
MRDPALLSAANSLAPLSILVVGDLMLDAYIRGTVSRISPEAPVMVVEQQSETWVPGGAANVANNLKALGARVMVAGVRGYDEPGDKLERALLEEGVITQGLIIDESRPTTVKTRVITQNQQVLRIDRETTHLLQPEVEAQLIAEITRLSGSIQALILSDYAKGSLTPTLIRSALDFAESHQILSAVNAKPANGFLYRRATVVTVNSAEACALGSTTAFQHDNEIERAARALRERIDCQNLLVTRGSNGVTVATEREVFSIPAYPVEVYDVAGAGDTVVSTFALALASGCDPHLAARLAMKAASLVVSKAGVATVTKSELEASLV